MNWSQRAWILLFLTLFSSSVSTEGWASEEPTDFYLHGWKWAAEPESMVRVPRRPASEHSDPAWMYQDQPLQVQKRLPSFRHRRSAAQVHWEVQRELDANP